MSTYISFFGKSQDFTAKYYDNKGPINDFNQVIKDFHLMESKYFTIDDVKNKEILARYYFKSEGKNYCLVKLYSFAQALNGNRVAGSIYGVGFISDKNINLTKENLALLRDAKLYFEKLSLDEMKFKKSDFSDATDKIWNGIANSKNGNLIDQLQLSEIKFNGNDNVVSFYVKDLFAEAIKLNERVSKQDTVYFSEDIDHLKRTQNKWGKEAFPIYKEDNNQYVLYKEQAEVKKSSGTGSDDVVVDDVAKLKSALADSEYNNKILKQDIEKLKKSSKQPIYIIYSLVATIILLLCYIYLYTEKKGVAVATKIEHIHDTVYLANNSNANSTDLEAEKKTTVATFQEYYKKIQDFHSKDSMLLKSYYQAILKLPYEKFKINIDPIKKKYVLKLDSANHIF